MKGVRSANGVRISGSSSPRDKCEDDEDEDMDADVDKDDESEDPIAEATRAMDTCLASHEFEWLSSSRNESRSASVTKPLQINTDVADVIRTERISSATIPPHPQRRSRKSSDYHSKRFKDREFSACQMSPNAAPCYDGVCRHRMSPMRSSWCCPSPPPHVPVIPVCLHHGGGSGMELVPCSQECCSEDGYFVRHCSPCHHYNVASHFVDCSPSSPQHTFNRNAGPRPHTVRRRDFSPSSSPLHRPYFANEVSQLILPPNSWEDHWKPPSQSGDTTGLQKIRQLESEKKNLILQVSVLNDQIEAQGEKIRELEAVLEDKKEMLHQTEQNYHQESMARAAIENNKLELMTELSSLRLRLTASERDRKSSDEKYRKIEHDFQTLCGKMSHANTDDGTSPLRMRMARNGTILTPFEKSSEFEKLHAALESVMASNEEKDKKIEDLRQALLKFRKINEYVLAGGHQRKPSDISLTDVLSDSRDGVPPPPSSPDSESIKLEGKNGSQRSPLGNSSRNDAKGVQNQLLSTTDLKSPKSVMGIHKSSSLENMSHTSPKASSLQNSYGTIPRQPGSQTLQQLQEQLQNFENGGSAMPSVPIHSYEGPHLSSIGGIAPKQNFSKDQGKETNRASRNKSSGVSFGKGFFKLRSGKRSSSAPELAPFENVIAIDEREVSSASPTPQPTMQPFFIKPEKEKSRGLLKFLTKWKRSGSQNIERVEGDFRRGGNRATAGPRLGWSRDVTFDPDIPFSFWGNDVIAEWFHKIGLSMYMGECRRWKCNGQQLMNASPNDIEKELNIKNPLHKKKLMLSIQRYKLDSLPATINLMDYQWVVRWLDDIGLPQYKDSFADARVDGRVLHYLTVDDLLTLKVTNQLHHISIKRGIQILREKNFDPHCLVRRSVPDEDKSYTSECVSLWTNHRVMEWLRTVDLSEYAPNLRGSGVHGALIVYEPKFNTDLFATLLNIAPTKTLLRRHLATHFKTIVGSQYVQAKRDVELDETNIPLTPNFKIKGVRKPQFALKKRKSKGDGEGEEFVCPMDIPVMATDPTPNGEKLIVRRNSDPTHCEVRETEVGSTSAEIGAVSKEITSLTDMLQEEKLLKDTNV